MLYSVHSTPSRPGWALLVFVVMELEMANCVIAATIVLTETLSTKHIIHTGISEMIHLYTSAAIPHHTMSDFNDHLRWRYATKKFDPTKKLAKEQLHALLEALRLSASSFGLQPYSFIVVENPALRAELKEHSWNQSQVTDASHLIALCAKRTVDMAYVDTCLKEIADVRGLPMDALKGYRERIGGHLLGKKPEQIAEWAKRQTYIALGFLLSAAALMHIDACPMEGFDPEQIDRILDLQKDGLTIVALCPIGFRASDDAFASAKKVRFALEKLVRRK